MKEESYLTDFQRRHAEKLTRLKERYTELKAERKNASTNHICAIIAEEFGYANSCAAKRALIRARAIDKKNNELP